MEQILAFVLGAGAVAFVWVVVVAFKTANKVKNMENTIEGIFHQIDRNDELVNRRIDGQIDFSTNLHKDSLAYTDSRVDKLEQKLTSVDEDGCKPTKEILKG